MRRLSVFLLAALSISASTPNPGTCGPWVSQTDGSAWRLCHDIHNLQYCEVRARGRIAPMQCLDD